MECMWLCLHARVCMASMCGEESLLYSDRARPLEWNAWWDSVMSGKSLNKHGWFQLTLLRVHVCVFEKEREGERERPSGLSICAVFTEAFYWSSHESHSFSYIQFLLCSVLLPSSPCRLLSFIFSLSCWCPLQTSSLILSSFRIPHHHYLHHYLTTSSVSCCLFFSSQRFSFCLILRSRRDRERTRLRCFGCVSLTMMLRIEESNFPNERFSLWLYFLERLLFLMTHSFMLHHWACKRSSCCFVFPGVGSAEIVWYRGSTTIRCTSFCLCYVHLSFWMCRMCHMYSTNLQSQKFCLVKLINFEMMLGKISQIKINFLI